MDKYKIQEDQYEFPYHHIPHISEDGSVVRFRYLRWGFKYYCYLLHIKGLVESFRPNSVLDIGCGDGKLLGILSENISKRVGIDLSERPIMFAKAFYPDLEFYVKDASELEETFDMAVAMEVLEHIPPGEVERFLNACASRVKEGGRLIISVPTTVVPLNKKHYRHYDIEVFKDVLLQSGASLKIVDVEHVYRESFFVRLYTKFSQNRLWLLEVGFLNKIFWKYVWKRLRITDSKHGHDMVVVMQKV